MTTVSYETFVKCFPSGRPSRLKVYYPFVIKAIERFNITKVAEFFATIGHESLDFVYAEEIASGAAYDTRTDLGNTPEIDGDGVKYKGRGPIQITGKAMYKIIGAILGLDLVNKPELLLLPEHGCAAAGAFWQYKKLDKQETFFEIQKRVNGLNRVTHLPNHWSDRVTRLKICKLVLSETTTAPK